MTPRLPWLGIGAATAVAVLLALRPGAPRLLWNTTASAPLGLWILKAEAHPAVGDWLALRPPAGLAVALDARGALPKGVLLLKQVGAAAPSRVCRRGDSLWIDGRWRAHIRSIDRWGRTLPQWRGCRALQPGELFLLNAAEGSFDSRYFGPLRAVDAVAQAQPWLTNAGGGHG